MCFGSTPKPTTPPTPPTERDANLAGTQKRAAAAAGAGPDSTMKSGLGGVPETGGAKSILGG